MEKDTRWRDRYLEVAGQLEIEEKRFQEAERQLLRLLSRLCVATTGLDSVLDPHLERLRKAVKGGANGKLISQAQRLGDALLKAQDERIKGDLLARLLDRSRLGGSQTKSALKLWRKLARAPDRASDDDLDELAAILFAHGAGNASGERKGGFIRRLIGDSGNANPNELLREVIDSIDWPERVRVRVTELRQRLVHAKSDDLWVEVIKEIGGLAATALDRAAQDAEASSAFLTQLTQRLEVIQKAVLDDAERRQASNDSGMRLGQAVRSEVDDLSASIGAEQELSRLRNQVLGVLDRIQRHVSTHLQAEAHRNAQAEQQAAEMKQQLQTLEREASGLRRQLEQTRQEAMRDALTGLPNRRALEERVAEELARWRRFGEPLALVVFDVDDFKKINDVFGHKAGDRALALISRVLSDSLRETDFIARYGGEELVVLLPGTNRETALEAADFMRSQVEGAGMHSHKKPVQITLSGGVALAAEGDDFGQLFERADKAMYQAKQQGKNRCVLAD